MQDRYRFRVWYKRGFLSRERIMLYDAEQTYDYMRGEPEIIPAECFGELLEDVQFVVMQCTGLKDKNGKLIYEGDVLKETYKDDELGKEGIDYTLVKWEKTEASFIMYRPDLPHDVTFFGDVFDDGDNSGVLKNFEVVGNIYENPALLKRKRRKIMSKTNKILDLVVTQHWFNLIKSGEKTHEYRVVDSWKRIAQFDYKKVRFRCGQTTKATSKERCVYGTIKSITEIDGKDTDLKINCPVFDIEFELIKEK